MWQLTCSHGLWLEQFISVALPHNIMVLIVGATVSATYYFVSLFLGS